MERVCALPILDHVQLQGPTKATSVCAYRAFMIASTHVPVSVAINDNLTNERTFVEHCGPETLIQLFI